MSGLESYRWNTGSLGSTALWKAMQRTQGGDAETSSMLLDAVLSIPFPFPPTASSAHIGNGLTNKLSKK